MHFALGQHAYDMSTKGISDRFLHPASRKRLQRLMGLGQKERCQRLLFAVSSMNRVPNKQRTMNAMR